MSQYAIVEAAPWKTKSGLLGLYQIVAETPQRYYVRHSAGGEKWLSGQNARPWVSKHDVLRIIEDAAQFEPILARYTEADKALSEIKARYRDEVVAAEERRRASLEDQP